MSKGVMIVILLITAFKKVGVHMNIVYIFDKAKADYLHSLGFIYNEKGIDNKKAYQFFGTDELMKSLASNFEQSDFLVSKNMCF